MAQPRQYADLTDLDDAPDIYETPELTDDTSTVPASTTVRSNSSASSYGDAQEEVSGIDRRRVQAEEARNRFEPARVSARDVDFSDRLVRQQTSYRTGTRRRRFPDDAEELGDFSEEEEEPVDHRLARLRREVEEVKAEVLEKGGTEKASDGGDQTSAGQEVALDDLQRLSEMLDSVYAQRPGASKGAEGLYMDELKRFRAGAAATGLDGDGQKPSAIPPTPQQDSGISSEQRANILNKAAEFDKRLASLESALGLDESIARQDASSDAPKPILHTLGSLDRQLAALSSPAASEALDTAGHRIRQLAQEAERLSGSPTTGTKSTNGTKTDAAPDADADAKINALHGTLATIESLSPSLPAVLERLRTLRLVHASASGAGAALDALERRQAEQAAELAQWREALAKVEAGVAEGEGAMTANVELVGGWVKELEARVAKLA